MMRRTVLSLLLPVMMLLGCVSAAAAEVGDTLTATYVFSTLKSPVFDLLPRSVRLDMVDYAREGRRYTAKNAMGGDACLDTLTADYASATISQVTSMQLRTLPSRRGPVAAIAYTIDALGSDSELFMYDAELRELPADKYFRMPTLRDFMLPSLQGDKRAEAQLQSLVPFICTRLSFSPVDTQLTATLSLQSLLGMEQWAKAQPLLMAPATLSYTWDGQKFKPIK